MVFFKKAKNRINGKWYPQSVAVGKPVTTDEVAKRLATESTVSPADTFAVLKSLGGVLGDFMANGRTMKLEGLGTFYYTAVSNCNGVDTADKVTASQITDVRVRFIPEKRTNSSHQVTTRWLVSDSIFWEEWAGKKSSASGNEETLDTCGTDTYAQTRGDEFPTAMYPPLIRYFPHCPLLPLRFLSLCDRTMG